MSNLFSAAGATPSKELRDYQQAAVKAIFDYFGEKTGNPLVVLPTGAGKSLVIADFIKQANELYPGTKIAVVTHVAELIKQNAEELSSHYPKADMSFCSAKLGKKNLTGNVVFGTIQSIYRRAFDFPQPVDLLLVDECHLISPENDTMYRKFIEDLKQANPYLKTIGFTASPFRQNQGMLHEGKKRFFTDIAYEISVLELINRGFLAPITTPSKAMRTKMNTSGVKVVGGDFVQAQLEKAVDIAAITTACVNEVMEHCHDRKKWLVFTAGINHCEHVRDEFRKHGVNCEMIHGKTLDSERNDIVNRFKNGDIQCLVNVMVFTVGFNNPAIDLLVFMRPTRSPVLYIQSAGRGMRIFPNKENCLLLDFGSVVESLGPIDQLRIKAKEKEDGEAPTKACQHCGHINHAAVLYCEACGAPFPPREVDIDQGASDAAVLSTQLAVEWRPVDMTRYYRHQKEGKPDSLRVEYLCGFKSFREWVCLEHSGYAREKACAWWRERVGGMVTAPANVSEALQRLSELRQPEEISVKKTGAYYEVVGAKFPQKVEAL